MTPLLEAKNLEKSFLFPEKLALLSAVSLAIYAGESVAITGRSGEGKTTLLHMLGSLEPFDRGELFFRGEPVSAHRAPRLRNRHFGFVFQAFNLLEDFTALENVSMPRRIAREPITREEGIALLGKVDLEKKSDLPVKLLSGGERQRVAIARALCNNPDILFADEPSGNLDKANADAVGHLLFDLVKSGQKALLLITHDETLAKRCDRRFVLSQGMLQIQNFD